MSLDPAELRQMAEAYTQAWCSRSSEAVASFFEENATSIINSGPPTVGRPAIADAMGAFFSDFPDLVLRIAGWQDWRLSDDLLIVEADGGFDAADYERQIREGI